MQFIVSTNTLQTHLQLISGVISTSTVLPILEDFLFELKEGNLTVHATDLETSMNTTFEVEGKEDFRIAIPAKILMDTLKNLPEQPLVFDIDESTFSIEITTDNGKYKLAGENGDDFPRIPLAEDVKSLTIPSDTLLNAINHTVFAVSTDEMRPAMNGVYFELGSEGMNFVATDGHRLVRYRRLDATSDQTASFIIPKKALNLLKNALPAGEQVDLSFNSQNAFFGTSDMQLICRLIDARYPDYNSVIPTDNPYQLNIPKADLQASLKRIDIYSNKTTHQVILRIKGSELNVSAQDLDFSNEAKETLTCNYQGEDIEIGFNAKFLIEMLGVLDSKEVRLEMSQPNRAGLLIPEETEENEDLLMLVMPVMISG